MSGCGVISNQTLGNITIIPKGFLRVVNNQIKDDTNQAIVLRGFCVSNGVYSESSAPTSSSTFYLNQNNYNEIKLSGANIVRFYLQYNWLDDAIASKFFTYMDEQLEMMASANLKAIISLHYFGTGSNGGFYNGTQANISELKSFWKKISDKYKISSVVAGYDLLNEPYCSGSFTESTLYSYYEDIIEDIRNNNDDHIIFISDPVNKYDNPNDSHFLSGAFQKLSDTNVVYQFHWYKPIKFTHQTVSDNYFQLGADYPYQKVDEENYKDGWYANTKKATTNTAGWITITSDVLNIDNLINTNPKIETTDKVGLSIIVGNTNAIIRINNIKVQKSTDSAFNNFTEVPIKNYDFSMKRRYDIYNLTFDNRPANWYVLKGNSNNNSADEITNYYIDTDHLKIDFTGASWVAGDWATLKANWWDGHRNYIDYIYGENYYYRIIFDINTNITQGEVFAGFEFYDCPTNKVELINKTFMDNAITSYYLDWANTNSVPLYCGEWGVADPSQTFNNFPNAPSQQVQWINDMSDILNTKGIHWTYHVYKNYDNLGFGVYDINSRTEIKNTVSSAF